MSKNLNQIFMANPITTNASTDLMYFMQSPYSSGTDAAMTFANFSAQFGAPYTAAALTRVNDTNVTLTLGGSPSTALLQATSLTVGWAGQLAVGRGGTGNSTFTAFSVLCAGTTATGAFQNVSGLGTSGQVLTSNGAGALPTWQASGGGGVTSAQIQSKAFVYGVDTGTSSAYVLTLSPAITSYTEGMLFEFQAAHTNVANATLNINGIGAQGLFIIDSTGQVAIPPNNILGGKTYQVLVSGGNFVVLNPSLLVYAGSLQAQAFTYANNDTGSANAYSITLTGFYQNYFVDGLSFWFVPGHTNTGASTLTINGMDTQNIVYPNGNALTGGELVAGQRYQIIQNSSTFNYVLVNPTVASAAQPVIEPYQDATLFFPRATPITNSTFVLATTTIWFSYIGKVTKTTTFNTVYLDLSLNTSAGINTCQFGLVSSPVPPNGVGQTLTLLVSSADNALSGTGIKKNASALSQSVAAGTYLWAAFSHNTGSALTSGNSSIDYGLGYCLTFSGDFLNSGTTSWAASVLTPAAGGGGVSCPYLMLST